MSASKRISVNLKDGSKGVVTHVYRTLITDKNGRRYYRHTLFGKKVGSKETFRKAVGAEDAEAIAWRLDVHIATVKKPSTTDYFKPRLPF